MTIHLVVLIAVCSLASASAAVTLAYARVFAPVREFFSRWVWPSELLGCPFCLAAWMSAATVVLARPAVPWPAWFVVVAAVHGGAALLLQPVKAAALGHVTPIDHEPPGTVDDPSPGDVVSVSSSLSAPPDVDSDGITFGFAWPDGPHAWRPVTTYREAEA